MQFENVKSLIITGYGINCEEEMAAAYRFAGASATIVHLSDIFLEKVSIHDFDILNIPGGFSFGDDLGAGKVLANKIRYKKLLSGKLFFDEIKTFLQNKKFILGICNGFQVLVKTGLLPNINNNYEQEVTLTNNDCGHFINSWCYHKANNVSNSFFFNGINLIHLPIRHGEGKLVFKDEIIRKEIENKGLNVLSYCEPNGNITKEYPHNPNGSDLNCAGLIDTSGQILGMMPHPEAYLSLFNSPEWSTKKRNTSNITDDGQGLTIFKNIVQHISNKK